jgi:AcrR family transcriptional regulator
MESGTTARAGGSPGRPYRSSRRQGQARRTRQRILDSAIAEFSRRGYGATTVPAIAAAAGVSVPTIEQVFKTKANLLKEAIDVAIAGDDEPVPVLERPAALIAAAAPTAETFLAAVSAAVADVAERAAGLILVVFDAAAGDPRLRPLAEQLRANRATMAGRIVDGLVTRAPLRPGNDRPHAVDVVWLLMDPAVFTRLTIDRGWSRQRFQQWFADSTARLLTDSAFPHLLLRTQGLPGAGTPGSESAGPDPR